MGHKYKPGDIVYTVNMLDPDYDNALTEPSIRSYRVEDIEPNGFGWHWYHLEDLQDGTSTYIKEQDLYGSVAEACMELLTDKFDVHRNSQELLLILRECLYWMLKENQNAKT